MGPLLYTQVMGIGADCLIPFEIAEISFTGMSDETSEESLTSRWLFPMYNIEMVYSEVLMTNILSSCPEGF